LSPSSLASSSSAFSFQPRRFAGSGIRTKNKTVAVTRPVKQFQPVLRMPYIDTPVRVRHGALKPQHPLLIKAAEDRENMNYAGRFAVVQIHDRQYKVTEDDLVMVDKLHVDVGQRILLDRVMLVGEREQTVIGRPIIPGASVSAIIEEQAQTQKVRIFKKHRRRNYKRTKGFRALVTVLRIESITPGTIVGSQPAAAAASEESSDSSAV
jgi:ribosomal protein L21